MNRKQAFAVYEKAQAKAWADYEKAKALEVEARRWRKNRKKALAVYEKAQAKAWADYEKAKALAWEAYNRLEAPMWEVFIEARTSAKTERMKAIASAKKALKEKEAENEQSNLDV